MLHLVQQGQLARLIAKMLCHWPCTTTWRAAVSALVYMMTNVAEMLPWVLRNNKLLQPYPVAKSTFDTTMSCCGITLGVIGTWSEYTAQVIDSGLHVCTLVYFSIPILNSWLTQHGLAYYVTKFESQSLRLRARLMRFWAALDEVICPQKPLPNPCIPPRLMKQY